MQYDFVCPVCEIPETVSASIHTGPGALDCSLGHGPMRRLYGSQTPTQIVHLGMADYIEKAYNGEESVPQLSIKKVRAIVDSQMATNRKGRANRRNYGDRR